MRTISHDYTDNASVTSITSLQSWLQNKHQTKLDERLEEATINDLKQSAMIFAPHQDDETLGCGGTILRKRALGAEVDIIFLTDGRTSHSHLMSPLVLTAIREKEAAAACAKLNVPEEHVAFLRYPDGTLKDIGDAATSAIFALLREKQPREVYIPYAGDPQPDHVATNSLIRTVLKVSGIKTTILEYPVWAWYQWPWVPLPSLKKRRNLRQVVANTAKLAAGSQLVRDLNYKVTIENVQGQKLQALQEHRTQMTRINDNPDWATLYDVANGEWIDYFLKRSEVFYRYEA